MPKIIIQLKRGEFVLDVPGLANRWKWPESDVEAFIVDLVAEGRLIHVVSDPRIRVFRIVDYDRMAQAFGVE